MACPAVPFGLPADAREFNLNTGREMFNCGDCLKIFISNVSLDCTKVKPICKSPVELSSYTNCGDGCIYSVNGRWRDRTNVQWKGKSGVDSSSPDGSVLTCLDDCGSIYLYTDMSITVRIYISADSVTSADVLNDCLENGAQILDNLGYIPHSINWHRSGLVVTDMTIDLNRNDWQSTTVTGSVIFQDDEGSTTSDRSGSANWNSRNGTGEIRETTTYYDDDCDTSDIGAIFSSLKSKCA